MFAVVPGGGGGEGWGGGVGGRGGGDSNVKCPDVCVGGLEMYPF